MMDYYKKCCLIIFPPELFPGDHFIEYEKLKTKEETVRLYGELVTHTQLITHDFPCAKHCYFSNESDFENNLNTDPFKKYVIKGEDTGTRMHFAFKNAFEEGYRKVIIIGSTTSGLEKRHLEEAFLSLKIIEFCIGPASNGSFYLLGMNQFEPELFHNKEWNKPSLCKSTIRDIGNRKAALYKLPVLSAP